MAPRHTLRRPDQPVRGPGARRGRAAPAQGREASLRRDVVETCRRLHERDLIGAAEGNVSVRLGGERFLVTPSGANKARLSPADLVVVGPDGRVLSGAGRAPVRQAQGRLRQAQGRPSTELRMHLAVYAARPDAGAVVHAHPVTAVAFTVAGLLPPNDLVPEAAVTLGEIAVAPFATPGTDEVPASLAPLLPRHDVVLLERHGALAIGATLSEAFDRMETLERVARVALAARLLGRCEPLSAGAVEKVLAAAGRPRRR